MAKTGKAERDAAIARLREWLPEGSTAYTILRHVSTSGMQRSISVLSIDATGPTGPREGVSIGWLSYNVHLALGVPDDSAREAVKVRGCGMDMGFHLVSELSHVLGYTLNHRWL